MEDEIYRLKVSGKSIFNQYKSSLITYLLAAIMTRILFKFDLITIAVFGFVFFLEFMISLSVFIDYYNENKDMEVLIYKNKFEFKSKNETRCINVEDIDQIRIFNSPLRGKGINDAIIMIDSFYYVRIRLNDREDFFLTSLLDYELDYMLIELFPTLVKRDDARIYNSLEKQSKRK